MGLAAGMLGLSWHTGVPLGAVPCAVSLWGNVGTGAAVDLFGGLAAVAEVVRRAHLALKPSGVGADRWRQAVSQSQALALGNSLFGMVAVIL